MKTFLQTRTFGLLRAFSRLITFGAVGAPAAQTTSHTGTVRTHRALEGRPATFSALGGRSSTRPALEGQLLTFSALRGRSSTIAALAGTVRTFPA